MRVDSRSRHGCPYRIDPERSAHENAFWPQSLRHRGGILECLGALRGGQARARRRLQTLGCFFANLIMNGLPRWHHPIFNWDRFSRATNDGFFLAIEARDPRFSEMETHDLLLETGGMHITIVHEED